MTLKRVIRAGFLYTLALMLIQLTIITWNKYYLCLPNANYIGMWVSTYTYQKHSYSMRLNISDENEWNLNVTSIDSGSLASHYETGRYVQSIKNMSASTEQNPRNVFFDVRQQDCNTIILSIKEKNVDLGWPAEILFKHVGPIAK